MDTETRLDAQLNARLDSRLDPLLSQRGNGAASAVDAELAPLLAAAGRLDGLRAAIPSTRFAGALQARLLSRADEVAAGQMVAGQVETDAPAPATPLARPLRRARAHPSHARWGAIAAAAVLALGLGTLTAAATADPGSPLYGLQEWQHGIQVQFASGEADRMRLHLQYANVALHDLDVAAHTSNGDAYANALGRLRNEEHAATTSLKMVPNSAQHDTLATQLDDLRAHMRQDLAAALPLIGWGNRLGTTAALADVGVNVPRVSSAIVTQLHDGNGSSGSDGGEHIWQIAVNGSGFEPGAMLYLDGQPAGKVISVTPTRLTATVQSDDQAQHAHAVGVVNPNGTADQTVHIARPGGDDNGGDSHGNKNPTPTPNDHRGDNSVGH